jgi:glycosyltransferase involved in cell wall biosynthesis
VIERPINALFVNSGILGQTTFARFVETAFRNDPQIRAHQIVLSENLTLVDRAIRKAMCLRLSPDGASRFKNLDLHRYRAEMHAGFLARRRIAALERAGSRFDVLHFHHQPTGWASLSRMRSTPAIVSIDCTTSLVRGRANSGLEARTYSLNAARDGKIFRAAALIVAPSQWAADAVRADYPDCETDIAVMPVPVQMEFFDEAWIAERSARAAEPGATPRVLFVGGDLRRKGGDDLLAVWRDADLGRVAALDVVTGCAPDPSVLSAGVTVHLGVAVHSPAWVDLWRRADVFVLPTREEAFGIVFEEAAAAGLPAIGTRLNAIPEIVTDEVTGLLVPPGDAAALARALHALVHDPDRRRAMGSRARAFAARTACADVYRSRLAAEIQRLARQ